VSDEGPESPGSDETGRKLSIVDAVCCVYFCAAGKSGLLVAILTGLGMEILIPEEVVAEARNKKIYGQLSTHIQRLQASTKVKILPRLVLEDERSAVLANVSRVRGMSVDLALSSRADLGEAVVIGHAKHLADSGHEVYVLIDDQGGQVLASGEGLGIITVEMLLLAGVQLGLLPAGKLKSTYESLRPFGAGLPSWKAGTLKTDYERWRREGG
jgi:hypothetical protein